MNLSETMCSNERTFIEKYTDKHKSFVLDFFVSSITKIKPHRIRDVYLRRHCKWGTFNISMRNLSGMYCMHSNILCVVRQVSYLINKMTASYKSALIKPYTRTLDLLFVMVINFFILHFKRYTSRHLIYTDRVPY